MKFSNQYRYIIIFFTLFYFIPICVSSQFKIKLDEKKLRCSLKEKLEKLQSDTLHKSNYYLDTEEYNHDYYSSVNKIEFVKQLINVFKLIDFQKDPASIEHITFMECYYWTEAYSNWFIIIKDKTGINNLFHIERSGLIEGLVKVKCMYTGPEYFVEMATRMYTINSCEGMNEDYIRMGRIKNNEFEEYTSSQKYTQGDIGIFKKMMALIENAIPISRIQKKE